MHRGSRFAAFGWLLVVALFAPSAARGQTTTTTTTTVTGPVVSPTSNVFPFRLLPNGTNLGVSTRPQNLNYLGINYSDCQEDMRLQFSIPISGFAGQALEVWASNIGDCTAATARGQGAVPTCWELYQQAGINSAATQSIMVTVNVRDIVGPQNAIPDPPTVAATQRQGEGLGLAACATQPSFTAVPMYIWFMAVDSTLAVDGTPYEYGATATPFVTDLVGPPAPTGATEQVGDTLFIINWTANVDSDTAGYDVYIDPIPGHEDAGSSGVQTILYCLDATTTSSSSSGSSSSSSSSSSSGASSSSGSLDGSDESDSSESDASDESDSSSSSSSSGSSSGGGCRDVITAGPTVGIGGTCTDTLLSSGSVIDSGTSSEVTTPIFDEAGDEIDSSVGNNGGGLSSVPAANLVGVENDGVTVSGVSVGTYTISGLQNMVTYYVAVAAVDGSGNIGPTSNVVCDYPAPVNDFWTLYRNAGGGAGGGFCALEAVGAPVSSTAGVTMLIGATAVGLQRRRRRRRERARGAAGTPS